MGTAFWLPTLITDDKGFSLTIAGIVVAIGATVTAPSNFFGGVLSDRLNRPLLIIGTSLIMLAVTLAILPIVDTLWALIAVIAVNAVFVQLYFGPLFAVPCGTSATRTPASSPASATSAPTSVRLPSRTGSGRSSKRRAPSTLHVDACRVVSRRCRRCRAHQPGARHCVLACRGGSCR